MTLWGIEKKLLAWEDEGVSDIMYTALLDGLAQEWCDGNYPNDELINDSRRSLVEKGLAPAVVKSIASSLKKYRNPFFMKEAGVNALVDEAGGRVAGEPELVIFFGSTVRVKRQAAALSFIRILRKLKISFEVLDAEPDSGFLSYQLGDFETAENQAKRVVTLLNGCKAKKLVSLSASAYRMFKTRYKQFGAALPEDLAVQHVTEFISDLLESGRLTVNKKISKKITYHDPASLGRFTFVHKAPRDLLDAITAPDHFVEMEWNRARANSAGETGGLSFTYPEIARYVARLRVEEALATGAEILACSDGLCEGMLELVSERPEIEIKSLIELVEAVL